MRLIDASKTNMQIVEIYNNERNEQVKSALRDVMKIIRESPTITPPPNDPLTLEELREMDGEPVWCINGNGGQWGLVHVFSAEGETYVECVTKTGFTMDKMTYGTMGIYAWLAYRRKPEEAQR